MREIAHETELCIIGGGMAGVCAAIAAARRGAKVVLMQDRPVLGGNASSEIRMWICGAHGPNNRETGILEEIMLENLYRNPDANFSVWDSVIYEKVKAEPNITLLLNCHCTGCEMDDGRIKSVYGIQLTNETRHTVASRLFADCSGDSVLAPLTGAEFRVGRESASEFNESIEPAEADRMTMGMSVLFQIRETDSPKPFIPPSFAYVYESDDSFPFREHDKKTNFWWIELGGNEDSICDTEEKRDELLKIVFGVWDHMKNRGDHGVENWQLEWIGFLPGKRESRRYVGDVIMNQNDVAAEGRFDDLVAYGGWTMDDHHPEGFLYPGPPNIFHPAPSPFGIPYRCLYSKNIENLLFAGRNISVTHAALSSTRVMATCAVLGQALGTAAAIAVQKNLAPRRIYETEMPNLQQQLMDDDCYLPFHRRRISRAAEEAVIMEDPGASVLKNGYDRPIGQEDNGWRCALGESLTYRLRNPIRIAKIRLVFNSDLNRAIHNMPCNYPLRQEGFHVPESLVKEYRMEISADGITYKTIRYEKNNYQRLVKFPVDSIGQYIRFTPLSTWGSVHNRTAFGEKAHIFAWDFE